MHVTQYLSVAGKKLYNEFKSRAIHHGPHGMTDAFTILLLINELAKLQKQVDELEASIVR